MKKKIQIFIAGAKDLSEQRQKLKAMISDLNHKNEEVDGAVAYSVSSYETFGNNQEEYNDFITNKAHLVIFVLKDRIGPRTEEEYLLSIQHQKVKGRPKVVVFMNAYDEVTSDIAYINGLLRGDDYYTSYKNDEDLVLKVKECLADFAGRGERVKVPWAAAKGMGWKVAAGLLATALLVLGVMCYFGHRDKQPILLIAGGGSAKNYIEQYRGVKVDHYPSSYYVHMPSGNSWLLITEEVISPQKEPRYYPVCISASRAKEEDFLKITSDEKFLKSGSVIEAYLGEDTLSVCLKNVPEVTGKLDAKCLREKEISVQELGNLMKDVDSLNVFATSPNSGTRTAYEKLLSIADVPMAEMNLLQFSEDTDFASINIENKPYMLLGSRCYKMRELNRLVANGDVVELIVYNEVDGRRQYSTKPIYFYFMAYEPTASNELTVPKQTLRLLEDLGVAVSDKVKDGKLKRSSQDSIILNFDRLPNWE